MSNTEVAKEPTHASNREWPTDLIASKFRALRASGSSVVDVNSPARKDDWAYVWAEELPDLLSAMGWEVSCGQTSPSRNLEEKDHKVHRALAELWHRYLDYDRTFDETSWTVKKTLPRIAKMTEWARNIITFLGDKGVSFEPHPRSAELDIFISYASRAAGSDLSEEFSQQLVTGGRNVWWAPKEIDVGSKWRPEVLQAVCSSNYLLLILDQPAVASNEVCAELAVFLARQPASRVLIASVSGEHYPALGARFVEFSLDGHQRLNSEPLITEENKIAQRSAERAVKKVDEIVQKHNSRQRSGNSKREEGSALPTGGDDIPSDPVPNGCLSDWPAPRLRVCTPFASITLGQRCTLGQFLGPHGQQVLAVGVESAILLDLERGGTSIIESSRSEINPGVTRMSGFLTTDSNRLFALVSSDGDLRGLELVDAGIDRPVTFATAVSTMTSNGRIMAEDVADMAVARAPGGFRVIVARNGRVRTRQVDAAGLIRRDGGTRVVDNVVAVSGWAERRVAAATASGEVTMWNAPTPRLPVETVPLTVPPVGTDGIRRLSGGLARQGDVVVALAESGTVHCWTRGRSRFAELPMSELLTDCVILQKASRLILAGAFSDTVAMWDMAELVPTD